MPAFFPEPGVSLARAIAEQLSSMHRNELIQPVTSTLSNTESTKDSEKQSLNELEKCKSKEMEKSLRMKKNSRKLPL